MKAASSPKHLVILGGGTGTQVILTGLKKYPHHLTAIVSVADSGGSTGRLRDEFGFQPVGDLRQALAALAKDGDQTWIRDLLLYRFSKGEGLIGHNLGNLILTALQDLTGSTAQAVSLASQIFQLHGDIYPSTLTKVDLVVEYADGSFVIGEHHLNPGEHGGQSIKKIHLSPKAALYPKAKTALTLADLVIISPGDLYASIMPNLSVTGIPLIFKHLKGKLIYVLNLMTVYTQTHNLTARGHVDVLESALHRHIDYVIINTTPVPKTIQNLYQHNHEFPVVDDLGSSPHTQVIRAPLITTKLVKPNSHDLIVRSYLRHDSQKLAKILISLCP